MILFITYLILLWFANAVHDADYYNKKNTHVSGAVLSVLIVIGMFIFPKLDYDIWNFINMIVLIFTARWVVFDISWNLITKHKWYYVGDTAMLDKIPNYIQFGLKILLIFLSIPIIISFINQLK